MSKGIPLLTSAGINAVAPGKHSTSILFSRHVLTAKNPGSEIPGVPASDINAIFSPDKIFSTTFPISLCSLNLWCERKGVSIL